MSSVFRSITYFLCHSKISGNSCENLWPLTCVGLIVHCHCVTCGLSHLWDLLYIVIVGFVASKIWGTYCPLSLWDLGNLTFVGLIVQCLGETYGL